MHLTSSRVEIRLKKVQTPEVLKEGTYNTTYNIQNLYILQQLQLNYIQQLHTITLRYTCNIVS